MGPCSRFVLGVVACLAYAMVWLVIVVLTGRGPREGSLADVWRWSRRVK